MISKLFLSKYRYYIRFIFSIVADNLKTGKKVQPIDLLPYSNFPVSKGEGGDFSGDVRGFSLILDDSITMQSKILHPVKV